VLIVLGCAIMLGTPLGAMWTAKARAVPETDHPGNSEPAAALRDQPPAPARLPVRPRAPIVPDRVDVQTDGGYRVVFADGALSITDARTDRVLLSGMDPLAYPTPAEVRVEVLPVADGVDLEVRIGNPTDTVLVHPVLSLSRFRFPAPLVWNFAGPPRARVFMPPEDDRSVITAHNATYPNEWYSPAMVFGDGLTTVGVSVLYDPVEYDQFMRLNLQGFGAGHRGEASPSWGLRITPEGVLQPGVERRYRITLRFVRAGLDAQGRWRGVSWLHTLVPYRDHFRALYGGVSYQRDPRPVAGVAFGHDNQISDRNPRGFAFPSLRPDLHGFGPWVTLLRRDVPRRGFQRLMIWAVSGLYDREREHNYPHDIFSGMAGEPNLARTVLSLRELAQPIRAEDGPDQRMQVGYWWGVVWRTRRQWDTPPAIALDPDNPDHLRLAVRELDTAIELGATLIGLDAFPQSTPARQYRYLAALRERAPGVTFVTELAASDLYHTQAPTWVNAWDIRGPHILADFLVPGHETWAGIRYDVIESRTGRRLNAFDRLDEVRRVARAGYVPVDLFGVALPEPIEAERSWMRSVPEDLRLPPAPPREGFRHALPMPPPSSVLGTLVGPER
jgi:hypothetical protein